MVGGWWFAEGVLIVVVVLDVVIKVGTNAGHPILGFKWNRESSMWFQR